MRVTRRGCTRSHGWRREAIEGGPKGGDQEGSRHRRQAMCAAAKCSVVCGAITIAKPRNPGNREKAIAHKESGCGQTLVGFFVYSPRSAHRTTENDCRIRLIAAAIPLLRPLPPAQCRCQVKTRFHFRCLRFWFLPAQIYLAGRPEKRPDLSGYAESFVATITRECPNLPLATTFAFKIGDLVPDSTASH